MSFAVPEGYTREEYIAKIKSDEEKAEKWNTIETLFKTISNDPVLPIEIWDDWNRWKNAAPFKEFPKPNLDECCPEAIKRLRKWREKAEPRLIAVPEGVSKQDFLLQIFQDHEKAEKWDEFQALEEEWRKEAKKFEKTKTDLQEAQRRLDAISAIVGRFETLITDTAKGMYCDSRHPELKVFLDQMKKAAAAEGEALTAEKPEDCPRKWISAPDEWCLSMCPRGADCSFDHAMLRKGEVAPETVSRDDAHSPDGIASLNPVIGGRRESVNPFEECLNCVMTKQIEGPVAECELRLNPKLIDLYHCVKGWREKAEPRPSSYAQP